MNRPLLRASKSLRRRPFRARRAVIAHAPLEYSAERVTPQWLPIVAAVLGLIVLAELVVALAVIA